MILRYWVASWPARLLGIVLVRSLSDLGLGSLLLVDGLGSKSIFGPSRCLALLSGTGFGRSGIEDSRSESNLGTNLFCLASNSSFSCSILSLSLRSSSVSDIMPGVQ